MADLNDLGVVSAAERGAELTLTHPGTNAPLDIVYHVLGFDAEPVVQAGRAFDRAEAKRTPDERVADTDSPMVRRNIALAIAAVTGWRGQTVKGKDDPYSEARKAEILASPEFVWIVSQVVAFGSKRGHFFPSSSGA